jgi:adenylate cyclase
MWCKGILTVLGTIWELYTAIFVLQDGTEDGPTGRKDFFATLSKNENGQDVIAETPVNLTEQERQRIIDDHQKFLLEKVVYRLSFGENIKHVWSVIFYQGLNQGLVMAKITLSSDSEQPERPGWLGDEITGMDKFTDRNLAVNPCGH